MLIGEIEGQHDDGIWVESFSGVLSVSAGPQRGSPEAVDITPDDARTLARLLIEAADKAEEK